MYLCTGSNSTRYANRKDGWADCWDCPGRFELVEDRSPASNHRVLPMHYEDGTLFERTIQQALSVTITPETAARHLRQIAEKATDCICRDPENHF